MRSLDLVLAGVAAVGAVASLGVLGERLGRARTTAVRDGVALSVSAPRWLEDQMDHGLTFAMPASFQPDLPRDGAHRLSVEVNVANRARTARSFAPESELALLSDAGGRWAPVHAEVPAVTLAPGEQVNVFVKFDLPKGDDAALRLAWARGPEEVALRAVPRPPPHARPEIDPRDAADWPEHPSALPEGDAARGRELYANRLGCAGCHGLPEAAGSATLGPALTGMAAVARERTGSDDAAAYVYRSLLAPNAVVAPDCNGTPCAVPSAMPPYAGVVTAQEMADLVAWVASR